MFVLFAVLLIGATALNLPAWLFARSRNQATWWLPLIGVPAVVAWVALATLGIGPQSLSNLVEPVAIAAFSVLACYTQVFLLNRRFKEFRRTSTALLLALVGGAVLLRLFMPLLPE